MISRITLFRESLNTGRGKMINKLKLGAAISTALLLLGSFVTQAAAEDCHRGTLDEAYCDRNLDQVADLPLDPKDWVDPKTIIFTRLRKEKRKNFSLSKILNHMISSLKESNLDTL